MRDLKTRHMKQKKMRPLSSSCSVFRRIWAKSSMNKELREESQSRREVEQAKSSPLAWWPQGPKTVFQHQTSFGSSKNGTSTFRASSSPLTLVVQPTLSTISWVLWPRSCWCKNSRRSKSKSATTSQTRTKKIKLMVLSRARYRILRSLPISIVKRKRKSGSVHKSIFMIRKLEP